MREDDQQIQADGMRFLALRGSLAHLGAMQGTLRAISADVVRLEAWPFAAIRSLQDYHEPAHWDVLTRTHTSCADDFLSHHEGIVAAHARDLARELLIRAGEELAAATTIDLRSDPKVPARIEAALLTAAEILEEMQVPDAALAHGIRTILQGLRDRVDTAGPLPDTARGVLNKVQAKEGGGEPTRYLLAERWIGLGNAQIGLMKTLLALDYAASREQGGLSPFFPSFVRTDAGASRNLQRAEEALYAAFLIH